VHTSFITLRRSLPAVLRLDNFSKPFAVLPVAASTVRIPVAKDSGSMVMRCALDTSLRCRNHNLHQCSKDQAVKEAAVKDDTSRQAHRAYGASFVDIELCA
jgi:hypothetical protein